MRALRENLASGNAPGVAELVKLHAPAREIVVSFDLPWPWGGERFELRTIKPINYIIGPLFSGKTRLAQRLAETIPNALFLGLDRLGGDGAAARAHLTANGLLRSRVETAQARLIEAGATSSHALTVLLAALEDDELDVLVIDMIEQGLDEGTQRAVISFLRRRVVQARPLFVMTRSSAILELAAIGADEAIILCPANHSPPTTVATHVGAPGYEAVATCLASPNVRARTEGVIAWRPPAA